MLTKSDVFKGGFLMPHPPIIIPAVGHGREKDAAKTLDALEKLSLRMADIQPETIVLISPHAPVFSDFVFFYEPIQPSNKLSGNLLQFGDLRRDAYPFDSELQKNILSCLTKNGIPAGSLSEVELQHYHLSGELDHGTLVPLRFLSKYHHVFKLIVLSSPSFEQDKLMLLGKVIREESQKLGRRILIIASGDLSHKVSNASPYGMADAGAQFDLQLVETMRNNDLPGILTIDKDLREQAAECGYHSLVILYGALKGLHLDTEVLSYEAPFGIGYCVASFVTTGNEVHLEASKPFNMQNTTDETGSAYVKLARKTIETYVLGQRKIKVNEVELTADMLSGRAGVFVSIHKHGDLRGCIGTIAPTTHCIADEIIQNAISASTSDPRFEPVAASELPDLEVHVDVLNPPEYISDKSLLDPKQYGVIVESGMRRGLLLPDLEGVDTVEYQLRIACMKAGISPETKYRISRFSVTRYES